jgi:hypothetical protein
MILMRNKKCTRSTKCEANASSSVASIVEMCGLSITVEYKYRRLSLYSTWNEPTQTSIFSLLVRYFKMGLDGVRESNESHLSDLV